MRKAGWIATWVLQILVGLLFVLLGVMKFREPVWADNFARWGFPAGFYMVTGALEAIGGLGLLVPRAARFAAWLLMTVMLGAALTHLVHGETRRLVAPIVYLVVLAAIAWWRRDSREEPQPLPPVTSAAIG